MKKLGKYTWFVFEKSLLVVIILCLIFAFFSCTFIFMGLFSNRPDHINNKGTVEFKNQIKASNTIIKKVDIYNQNASLNIDYKLKSSPKPEELRDIFNSTNEFITTDEDIKNQLSKANEQVFIRMTYGDKVYSYWGSQHIRNIANSDGTVSTEYYTTWDRH